MFKKIPEEFFSILTALLVSLLSYLPLLFFSKESVEKYSLDISLIIVILFLSISLYTNPSRFKYPLLSKLVSIFFFFHFFFFPLIYVYMLNNNPDSFQIDKHIYSIEKHEEFQNVNTIYGNDIDENKKLIDYFLQHERDFLELKSNQLILNKVYFLKKFFVIKGFRVLMSNKHGPEPQEVLNIYDFKYNFINYFDLNDEGNSLKNILENEKNQLINKSYLKADELKKIGENKFWSFKRVLPYTINIFFTDNFSPKNKLSNIIYFIHNIFIFMLLLSLIFGLIQNYLVPTINKE